MRPAVLWFLLTQLALDMATFRLATAISSVQILQR